MPAVPTLLELVDALPEIYQPIFGHPEFDNRSVRNVSDRLEPVIKIYNALSKKLDRPLRVLDLGCAQGFFSFNLAMAGAKVVGLDFLGANINICNMLVLENPNLDIRFKIFEIEKVPEVIPDDAFDIVLGLSVLHHLCYHNSKEMVRDYVARLLRKIPVALLELALASENTKITSKLPQNIEDLIGGVDYYKILDWYPSPMGTRPFYYCSSQFSYIENQLAELRTRD